MSKEKRLTRRQERMIAMSKGRYPGEDQLKEQLAFIDGYKFARNDNFGFGTMFGMFIIAVFLTLVLFGLSTNPKNRTSYPEADAILNSSEWKIDTLKTITNGRDTSTTYRFTKKDFNSIKNN